MFGQGQGDSQGPNFFCLASTGSQSPNSEDIHCMHLLTCIKLCTRRHSFGALSFNLGTCFEHFEGNG